MARNDRDDDDEDRLKCNFYLIKSHKEGEEEESAAAAPGLFPVERPV